MTRATRLGAVLALVTLGATAVAAGPRTVQISSREDPGALAAWELELRALEQAGVLRHARTLADTLMPERRHERLDQLHRGVPVWGGEVVRQLEGDRTLSIFATLHDGIDVDPQPLLSVEQATAAVAARHGVEPGPRFPPQLVVLPLASGGYALAWRIRVFTGSDLVATFLDAHDGSLLLEVSDLHTAASIGLARGVYGDQKKLSADSASGSFVSRDVLRPNQIETFDLKGDLNRTLLFFNGLIGLDQSDLGNDADNSWDDGALGDAHIYTGYFYDYMFERFGRRGIDGNNLPIRTLVHMVRREDVFLYSNQIVNLFFVNAFYLGDGVVAYGEGLPPGLTLGGLEWTWFSAGIDVVGHELGHGVAEFTSRLQGQNEPGALGEGFSDVLGTGLEFFIQPPGSGRLRADYLLGEDVTTPGVIRSMVRPMDVGDPDHYAIRYQGPDDGGGVHINASIVGHAFYLAVEGGVNRFSGQSVTGVGAARRANIERAFFRGFTLFLPSSASFPMARAATELAAAELFGAGSAEATAIRQAWSAVGVP